MPFNQLGLCATLVETVIRLGFDTPTLVQSQCIPAVLAGSDVLATANTGSGKTAAYVLPLLQAWQLQPSKNQCLILVPTRELAQQVADVVLQMAVNLERCKVVSLIGGVSINPQLQALRGGADFVVATPGRLLDVLRHNGFDIWSTTHLVLDEADRLLDAGFADELDAVLDELDANCQSLMFSATMPVKLEALAKRILNKPLRIAVETSLPELIERAISVDKSRRAELLLQLLKSTSFSDGVEGVLVFCASKLEVDQLRATLNAAGVESAALYGDLPQLERFEAVQAMKQGRVEILVATDLAARGLDIVALAMVVNYDLPRAAPVYTHRVGRSGRAGVAGLAISFVDVDSVAHFNLIQKRTNRAIELEVIEGFEPTDIATLRDLVGDANGGIKGKRMSKKDKLRAAAKKLKPKP